MLQTVLRRVRAPVRGIPHLSLRAFSYVSTHRTFPASLCWFHLHRDSRLFDRAFEQGDREYEDGIEVSADGLVYPNITIECMDAKETSSSLSANLSSLQWSLTHAKHTPYAEDHTDVVWLLPRQFGKPGHCWTSRTSLFVHTKRQSNPVVDMRDADFISYEALLPRNHWFFPVSGILASLYSLRIPCHWTVSSK